MESDKTDAREITIIYDGSCPVCDAYVRYTRLREALDIKLIDARQEPGMLRELAQYGLDLEEGMVVFFGGRRFHGADAMHLLATLTTRSGTWNRLNRWLFSNPRHSALFYPALKQGRRILLWLLRRPPLQI
jgi:predicted DCC family thiol-disulfide oxidoreductase YuxK